MRPVWILATFALLLLVSCSGGGAGATVTPTATNETPSAPSTSTSPSQTPTQAAAATPTKTPLAVPMAGAGRRAERPGCRLEVAVGQVLRVPLGESRRQGGRGVGFWPAAEGRLHAGAGPRDAPRRHVGDRNVARRHAFAGVSNGNGRRRLSTQGRRMGRCSPGTGQPAPSCGGFRSRACRHRSRWLAGCSLSLTVTRHRGVSTPWLAPLSFVDRESPGWQRLGR